MKSTTKKSLLLVLCAIVLVVATALVTVAFFTDTDSVKNTFTSGHVDITLDEAKVTTAGVKDGASRVKSNVYHLVPSHNYVKDPVVTVKANSEDSYIFLKVDNAISSVEVAANTTGKTVENQILANNWTKLPSVAGVYYKEYTKAASDTKIPTFTEFKVNPQATETQLAAFDTSKDASKAITVTAYAIQKEGMTSVANAWTQVSAN